MSLVCGSCTEREKANDDTAGRSLGLVQPPGRREGACRGQKPKALSTDATFAGGPVCSSRETAASGVAAEPRDRLTRNVRSINQGRKSLGGSEKNMPKPNDKPFAIPKQLVWEAYRQVAANKGAPGVDEQTLGEFEADLRNNLYRLWNRLSSGSYFPPPVRAVEIPKPHG